MTQQEHKVLKFILKNCTDQFQFRNKHANDPELVAFEQHQCIMLIASSVLDMMTYSVIESEVEQRQDSQFEVSRVFAVSS